MPAVVCLSGMQFQDCSKNWRQSVRVEMVPQHLCVGKWVLIRRDTMLGHGHIL